MTGFQSKELIVSAGLSLGDVDQYPTIDVTLDGADEYVSLISLPLIRILIKIRVDAKLNCIKGGGACHLREKVLAEAAKTFILVADYRKNVEYLGTNVRLSPSFPPSFPFFFLRSLIYKNTVQTRSPNRSSPIRLRQSPPKPPSHHRIT